MCHLFIFYSYYNVPKEDKGKSNLKIEKLDSRRQHSIFYQAVDRLKKSWPD